MEDKNPKNNVGLTPLHIATGEDKNLTKYIGTTPLHNSKSLKNLTTYHQKYGR